MSKRNGKKNKQARTVASYQKAVNDCLMDSWLEAGSHIPKLTYHQDMPFAKSVLTMVETAGITNVLKAGGKKGYAQKAADEAMDIAMNKPLKWTWAVMVIQSDGDKQWYDHIVHTYDSPVIMGDQEVLDLLTKHRKDVMVNCNPMYVIGVATFMFPDGNMDLESMMPQFYERIESFGVLNLDKQLENVHAILENANDPLVDRAKEEGFWDDLGKLLYINSTEG